MQGLAERITKVFNRLGRKRTSEVRHGSEEKVRPINNLSNLKTGRTMGGSGRVCKQRVGGAERGGAGRDADRSVRPGNKCPVCGPAIKDTTSG